MRERQCTMDATDGFGIFNVNKMIESSRNWSLANDVELLKSLENISQNIMNNASLTLRSMDNLEDSLDETFLRVRTVANKFQAIADNQFIENRVQEEEEDFILANNKSGDSMDYQGTNVASKTQVSEAIRECNNVLCRKKESTFLSGVNLQDEAVNKSPSVLTAVKTHKDLTIINTAQQDSDDVHQNHLRNHDVKVHDAFSESEEDIDETDHAPPTYQQAGGIKDVLAEIHKVVPKWDPDLDVNAGIDIFRQPTAKASANDSQKAITRVDSSPKKDDSEISNLGHPVSQPKSPSQSIPVDTRKKPVAPVSANIGKINNTQAHANAEKEMLKSSVATSRDQLLSGPNFASFKEDLARVLSGGKRSVRKHSSSDSDSSKEDFSSPSCDLSAERDDEKLHSSNKSLTSPQTAFSKMPPFGKAASSKPAIVQTPASSVKDQTINPVTLPTVSTNVLESLSKGRAKLKGRRRPPSRKHRQSQIEGETSSIKSPGFEENLSKSPQSEENSCTESASTQPGSNILSPATDEEDLFVLPAFEPSNEPPSIGIFFGNSLLSPGASIDDGRSPSPLFPVTPVVNDDLFTAGKRLSNPIENKTIEKIAHVVIDRSTAPPNPKSVPVEEKRRDSTHDIFSQSPPKFVDERQETRKISKDENPPPSPDFDLFSNSSKTATARPDQLDLFSAESEDNTFSSSPPLFSDWAGTKTPANKSASQLKSDSKPSKSSLKSELKWDLLNSDDLSEDLFRPRSKQPPVLDKPASKTSENLPNGNVSATEQEYIFSSSTSSKEKQTTERGGLFDDINEFLSSDIFSDSSPLMRLSLSKNLKENSLFGSDEDDDDDSLFKSSKKLPTSITPSLGPPDKAQGTTQSKSTSVVTSSIRKPVDDPLSTMNETD